MTQLIFDEGYWEALPLGWLVLDPDPLRPLDPDHIADLAESFRLLNRGPMDPLVVTPIGQHQYKILSGNHRYMALKQGGWTEAPCQIIHPDTEVEAFLVKLHTNTKRKNLSDLEACEALVKEQEIYERFYPETRWGRNQRKRQNVVSSEESFTQIKSKAVGITQRSLQRDLRIGKIVLEIPDLKAAGATKTQALAIAKRKPEERETLKAALAKAPTPADKAQVLAAMTRQRPALASVAEPSPPKTPPVPPPAPQMPPIPQGSPVPSALKEARPPQPPPADPIDQTYTLLQALEALLTKGTHWQPGPKWDQRFHGDDRRLLLNVAIALYIAHAKLFPDATPPGPPPGTTR